MINKIMALLNHAIPVGIAFKGLQKINPRIGKFLTGAVTGGYTTDQAIDYLRDKFQTNKDSGEGFGQRPDERASARQVENSKQIPKLAMNAASLAGGLGGGLAASSLSNLFEKEQLPEMATNDEEAGFTDTPQKKSLSQGLQEDFDGYYGQKTQPNQRNILQQYSPELFQFIKSEIQNGSSPIKAATDAATSGKFSRIIKKIQQDHKVGFGEVVQSIFQNEKSHQKPQQQGKGQQALMQSMQQLTQILGRGK